LVDVADLGRPFSAGEFCRLAAAACEAAWTSNHVPVLCGGTGLYLKALLEGLADLPPVPPELRIALVHEWREHGLEPLLSRLDRADPSLAAGIDRSNPRRVLRALEVFEATGKPLSAWQASATRPSLAPDRTLWLGLDPGRDALNARITARTDQCLRDGWLKEVSDLAERHGDEALKNCPAIGYPELLDHLRGRLGLAEAREAILGRTRRYARRQGTWFRAQVGIQWATSAEPLNAKARSFLQA
ncbi:MAG TPA: tRNA (adenosine(37)-N6)-dimethylallyltransferase MiaA, partial [bacterium]|nr:tRNA (adenosine(37)-N6)-dimethylallyltransferase MiaA [bacterium]